jgi:U3 small nucleolar RNA-associated protein 18
MKSRNTDDMSDGDSFGGFSEDEEMREASARREKATAEALADKDSDEEELERLVLGGRASFREALFRDEFSADSTALVLAGDGAEDATPGHGKLDDSALFVFDTGRDADAQKAAISASKAGQAGAEDVAWVDSDDERLTVSLAGVAQRRKLRTVEDEDVVSGTEYARRLRQQYLRLYPVPDWAQEGRAKNSRRRRSSGSHNNSDSDSSSGSDADEEASQLESALPLEKFLRDVGSFNGDGARFPTCTRRPCRR